MMYVPAVKLFIHSELSGAVSQIQVNCAQWEKSGARTEHNREKLEIYTVSPKGIVIIGRRASWTLG